MKLRSVLPFALLLLAAACNAQNGPTAASTVTLSWTQSTAPGVTHNCVYRGNSAGVYTLPALFCSDTPVTTYTDTSVTPGTSYHYAVTAQVGAIGSIAESPYSSDAVAVMPKIPGAPSAVIVVIK